MASQAIRAATLTIAPERRAHSLHSYFVRPGLPGPSIELTVERTRDGRSFSTRRVVASQDGEAIFILDASFHVDEGGDDWQPDRRIDVPLPDELPAKARAASPSNWMAAFEVVPVRPTEGFGLHPCWVRLREEIGTEEALHVCALTYVSDLAVIASARAPGSTAAWGGASLDHAVWFHRLPRLDDWVLIDLVPQTVAGGRGWYTGAFYTADGTRLASIAQETLFKNTTV